MSERLRRRIVEYAIANRDRLVWKRRLLAVCYGASLVTLNKIR